VIDILDGDDGFHGHSARISPHGRPLRGRRTINAAKNTMAQEVLRLRVLIGTTDRT
jgi:hypothetical protein